MNVLSCTESTCKVHVKLHSVLWMATELNRTNPDIPHTSTISTDAVTPPTTLTSLVIAHSLPTGGANILRFDSPEPAATEPDSGLSSIEEGSLGRSPNSASSDPDTPRSRKHRKHRRRDSDGIVEDEVTVKTEPPSPKKSKKRRREEAAADERETPGKKKRRRGDPEDEEESGGEMYLPDPELPTTSHKKKKRKGPAELNGSVSGMLR